MKEMYSVDLECISSIFKSEAPVLSNFTNRSAKKLAIKPPATVSRSAYAAAIHDVSCDPFFSTLELSAVKPWSVRIARESGCKIADCVFSAKRGLIRGDGKVGKDIVTLNEEKREVTFVKEGDVVESVSVILRTQYCYEIYTRNPREEIRIKFWLCCVVVKYTTPAMVKLVNEIVAPTSSVVNHDTVSHQMTSNCDKVEGNALFSLSASRLRNAH